MCAIHGANPWSALHIIGSSAKVAHQTLDLAISVRVRFPKPPAIGITGTSIKSNMLRWLTAWNRQAILCAYHTMVSVPGLYPAVILGISRFDSWWAYHHGAMSEWFKEPVLKTGGQKCSQRSNRCCIATLAPDSE